MTRHRTLVFTIAAAIALTIAAASAGARTIACRHPQTLTLQNDARLPASQLPPVERAIERQSLDLHRTWGAPCARFAPGGWPIHLIRGPISACADDEACHDHAAPLGQPEAYASTTVLWSDGSPQPWSEEASHEAIEMLIDPYGHRLTLAGRLIEPCDRVDIVRYRYGRNDPWLQDFALPADYAIHPRGRLDLERALRPDGSISLDAGPLLQIDGMNLTAGPIGVIRP